MAKDELDKATRELIPKKIGRPSIYEDGIPMTAAERQERTRAGRKAVQVLMTEAQLKKLTKYCARHEISRHELVCSMIKRLRMSIPPDDV